MANSYSILSGFHTSMHSHLNFFVWITLDGNVTKWTLLAHKVVSTVIISLSECIWPFLRGKKTAVCYTGIDITMILKSAAWVDSFTKWRLLIYSVRHWIVHGLHITQMWKVWHHRARFVMLVILFASHLVLSGVFHCILTSWNISRWTSCMRRKIWNDAQVQLHYNSKAATGSLPQTDCHSPSSWLRHIKGATCKSQDRHYLKRTRI